MMKKKIIAIAALLVLFGIVPVGISAKEEEGKQNQENVAIEIEVPAVNSTYQYTGQDIVVIPNNKGYSIKGKQGKDSGTYSVTLKLKSGYCWIGGSTEDKTFTWEIKPVNVILKGASIRDKAYDNGKKAEVVKLVMEDEYGKSFTSNQITASAEFADSNVGNNKKVIVKISTKDRNINILNDTIETTGNIVEKLAGSESKTKPKGEPSYVEITSEGKTLADAKLEKGTISVEGKIDWLYPDSTMVEPNKEYAWVFTPTDLNKYQIISGRVVLYKLEIKEEENNKPDSGYNTGSGNTTPGTEDGNNNDTGNNNNNNNNNTGNNNNNNNNTGNNNNNNNNNNNTGNNNNNNNNNTGNNNNSNNNTGSNNNNSNNNNTGNNNNNNNNNNTGNNNNSNNNNTGNNNNNTANNNNSVSNNTVSNNSVSQNGTTNKKPQVVEDKRTEQQKLVDNIKDKTNATLTVNKTKKKEDFRLEIRGTYPKEKITKEMQEQGILDTEIVREKMKNAIKSNNTGFTAENNSLYDVSLIYTKDYGSTWQKATKDKFPSDGYLKISLPIPGQLDPAIYDFAVAHMFTNNDYGKIPGEIEIPAVVERTDSYGIHYLDFYVTGLSPIMVTWEKSGGLQADNSTEEIVVTDPQEGEVSDNSITTQEAQEDLSKEVIIKLVVIAAGALLFLIIVLWIAKKIAWG